MRLIQPRLSRHGRRSLDRSVDQGSWPVSERSSPDAPPRRYGLPSVHSSKPEQGKPPSLPSMPLSLRGFWPWLAAIHDPADNEKRKTPVKPSRSDFGLFLIGVAVRGAKVHGQDIFVVSMVAGRGASFREIFSGLRPHTSKQNLKSHERGRVGRPTKPRSLRNLDARLLNLSSLIFQ